MSRGNSELAMCLTLNHLKWMWGIIIRKIGFILTFFEIMPHGNMSLVNCVITICDN